MTRSARRQPVRRVGGVDHLDPQPRAGAAGRPPRGRRRRCCPCRRRRRPGARRRRRAGAGRRRARAAPGPGDQHLDRLGSGGVDGRHLGGGQDRQHDGAIMPAMGRVHRFRRRHRRALRRHPRRSDRGQATSSTAIAAVAPAKGRSSRSGSVPASSPRPSPSAGFARPSGIDLSAGDARAGREPAARAARRGRRQGAAGPRRRRPPASSPSTCCTSSTTSPAAVGAGRPDAPAPAAGSPSPAIDGDRQRRRRHERGPRRRRPPAAPVPTSVGRARSSPPGAPLGLRLVHDGFHERLVVRARPRTGGRAAARRPHVVLVLGPARRRLGSGGATRDRSAPRPAGAGPTAPALDGTPDRGVRAGLTSRRWSPWRCSTRTGASTRSGATPGSSTPLTSPPRPAGS